MRPLAAVPLAPACAVVAAALVVLGGCTTSGDDDGVRTPGGPSDQPRATASASGSAAAPDGPDCARVWQAGEVLPADYALCVQDGAAGVQDVTECADGPPLIVFDDELFARPGQEVQASAASPVQDTEEFAAAFAECTGG